MNVVKVVIKLELILRLYYLIYIYYCGGFYFYGYSYFKVNFFSILIGRKSRLFWII